MIIWVLEHWTEFDGWCCVKGVDPMELSSLRFYNLAMFYLRDGKTDEEVKDLHEELSLLDSIDHPLHMLYYNNPKVKKGTTTSHPSPSPSPIVSDNTGYVPSWWRGENANAKIAKNIMTQLPK